MTETEKARREPQVRAQLTGLIKARETLYEKFEVLSQRLNDVLRKPEDPSAKAEKSLPSDQEDLCDLAKVLRIERVSIEDMVSKIASLCDLLEV